MSADRRLIESGNALTLAESQEWLGHDESGTRIGPDTIAAPEESRPMGGDSPGPDRGFVNHRQQGDLPLTKLHDPHAAHLRPCQPRTTN